jgi:hypothetical protein
MQRLGPFTVLRNAFAVLFSGQNLALGLLLAVFTGGGGWLLADAASGVVYDRWLVGEFATIAEQELAYKGLAVTPEKAKETARSRLDAYNADPEAFRKEKAYAPYAQAAQGRGALLMSQLPQLVVLTIWGCFVGAFAAAAGLYMWVQHEKGLPSTVYGGLNYGLNRFKRVLGPHARAFFIVQLGNVVIVPGILFGLQYAFVDAIATLDQAEPDPLARSRKLTAGRRGTLFRTFALFLVWWLPFQLVITFYLQGMGALELAIGGTIDHLVLLLVDLCMVQYYLDLFRKPTAAATVASAVDLTKAPAT